MRSGRPASTPRRRRPPGTKWSRSAKKLTKRDASGDGHASGACRFPSTGFPYWLFQALATQTGAILANRDGTKVAYNDPKVVEAAQFLADLSQKHT